jgi:CRP-like cAMP-binding protein
MNFMSAKSPVTVELGNALYVITSGEADIVVGTESVADGSHIVLQAGECFGEMALLIASPRTAFVVART